MIYLYHCTSIDAAIDIFKTGIFKTSDSHGDQCINLHLRHGNLRTIHQAVNPECFILFSWSSPAIGQGAIRLKDSLLNELYSEWSGNTYSTGIWRTRIRAPYHGNDLIMTEIEFNSSHLRKRLIEQYGMQRKTALSKLFYKFSYRKKKLLGS